MATIDKIRLNGTEYTIVDGTKYTNEEVNAAIAAATSALSESFDEVLDDYVTNDELTAYTYDKATIDEKVGDAFDSDSYYDKTAVDGKLAEKVDVTAFTQYQGEVTSKFAEKVDVTAFTEYKGEVAAELGEKVDTTAFTQYQGEVAAELADKLEAADIANYFDGASYNDSTKNIEFTHDGTVKATVSALPFIKDGMVDNVEVKDGKLVITFNTDAGKEAIELEITDIFDASNYYTKEQADKQFGTLAEQTQLRSDVEDLMGEVATLEADKADKGEAYTKAESDGKYATKADLGNKQGALKGNYIFKVSSTADGSGIESLGNGFDGSSMTVNEKVIFKTINGEKIIGNTNISLPTSEDVASAVDAAKTELQGEISGKVSLQDLFDTFAETKKVKQIQDSFDGKNLMVDYDNLFGTRTDPPTSIPFKTINGQGILGDGNIEVAPKATVEGTTLILG